MVVEQKRGFDTAAKRAVRRSVLASTSDICAVVRRGLSGKEFLSRSNE